MVIYSRTRKSRQCMISFAQNNEDVLIDRVFRKPAGFYIDVGAARPIHSSTTKYFSLQGWRGINVEPMPGFFAEIARDRPRDVNLQCAAGRVPGRAPFHITRDPGTSTLSASQIADMDPQDATGVQMTEVQVRTLSDICAEFVTGEIDFLKIDAEGAEADVIAGADWQRFRPRLLVIEATKPWTSEPAWSEWEPTLLAHGYGLAFFDGINRYYLRAEDAALAVQFSVPVNVLDEYVRYSEFMLQREVEELRKRFGAA